MVGPGGAILGAAAENGDKQAGSFYSGLLVFHCLAILSSESFPLAAHAVLLPLLRSSCDCAAGPPPSLGSWAPSRAATSMDDDQRFLLDLQGYLVIPSLLSRDQVAAANAAVDHHFASAPPIRRGSADPSAGGLLSEESPGLVGEQGRAEFYGFLGWPAPHCDIFRELMVRPTPPHHLSPSHHLRPPHHLRCRSTRPCSRSCWSCWTTPFAWITCTASG